jgi:ABC-type uncharacterized transport system substrate-binding protein
VNTIHTKNLPGTLLFNAKRAVICLLLLPSIAFSQERVLTVMSNSGKIYQEFYSALNKKLDKSTKSAKINISEVNAETLNNFEIIIPVGYQAAKVVSKYKSKSSIVYSLIPDDELLRSKLPCQNTACYKIYINQPVERYIKLYKVLFPQGKRLAHASAREKSKLIRKLKNTARNNGVSLKNIYIKKEDNIPRAFIENLNNDDVLLALPDTAIYNANNAKSIILSTYHANVPIIAYSKSFAKAGALISLYSSIENIADKTAAIANEIIANKILKQKEYYPDDFMLEINVSVARSLNINIDSEEIIMRKIK